MPFKYKSLSAVVVAALVVATFSGPADARVKKKKRSSVVHPTPNKSLRSGLALAASPRFNMTAGAWAPGLTRVLPVRARPQRAHLLSPR